MSRLIESIRLWNGTLSRLSLHQQRINISCQHLFKTLPTWNLERELENSSVPMNGLFKCRVVYDQHFFQISFEPYVVKPINTLKLVEDNFIEYEFKFEDRSGLMKLQSLKGECDEVLIIKNGLVTDATYANIAFLKNGSWFTPQSVLLKGTMRQYLLDEGIISLTSVSKLNVFDFEKFKLINAMLEWDSPAVDISNIKS